MLSLTIPVLGLVALAIALPYALAALLPEGVGWLLVNAGLSALVLMVASTGYFVFAYATQVPGAPGLLIRMAGEAPETAWHFLRLGAMSALIWLPVLVLALSAQPKRWKEKVW